MSFILDALKKSEIERQRQSVPGLVDSGIARPRSRLPIWVIAFSGLLAVNLLVLSWVLMRSWMTAPRAPATATVQTHRAQSAPSITPASQPFSPLDAPVYAPEIPVAAAPTTATVVPAPALSASAHRRDPRLSDEDRKNDDDEILPTINEVSLSGAQALPELHLDVHVFATNSADRFVYVNMRKYHEGATLQEGPVVERIRRDGVILSYQGLRFLLPRQ